MTSEQSSAVDIKTLELHTDLPTQRKSLTCSPRRHLRHSILVNHYLIAFRDYKRSYCGDIIVLLLYNVNLCASTGKLITCVVTNIAHRRPQGESYDQAIRNDETGLWQCPFCQQDNFPELSEVGIFLVLF